MRKQIDGLGESRGAVQAEIHRIEQAKGKPKLAGKPLRPATARWESGLFNQRQKELHQVLESCRQGREPGWAAGFVQRMNERKRKRTVAGGPKTNSNT